ncbi:uncharacterized protein A1O5_13397 [Cladophialophora psammophila CBS 110553]|uniref:Uncharacterized protein n=1 Tax=Cladophialophora psammophila CBS 110553 TaxID=1182543 RepID=W9VCP8_9EURO|nr:uncharacterized protein A1O5_13397 [Cladophialophora psammophila CBS 110553]EXJ53357.1 hypothetical protein A1O5_13397 [Cladophialophora psammophila CBS 110553]
MVIDPLTALGLASNIISFIDFGVQALAKGRELHKSATGRLIEHDEFRSAIGRLQQLREGIDISLQSLSSRTGLTHAEAALQEITAECQKISEEFQDALSTFTAQPGQSPWKSFRQAFEALWKKDGLERMQQRLNNQSEQLVLHLLVVVSQRQKDNSDQLYAKTSDAEAHILRAIEASRRDLKADLDELVKLNRDRRGRDQDLKFARGITTLTQARSSEIQKLSDNVSGKLSNDIICDLILHSLQFPQIRDRKLQIGARAAHPNTFTWIFNKGAQNGLENSNFAKWVEAKHGSKNIFWVAGRPGSGKSTLMHFLSLAPQTNDAVACWTEQMPLLQAASFFWLSGTRLQKSLSGLLRALLYDLLCQDVSLIEEVAPLRWRAYSLGFSTPASWSNAELIEALRDLVQATAASHRIFLLIDGLDEFEGSFAEQSELVEYLKSLAHWANIKVCVSSRPWPIFESAFGNYPHFRLEELTRNDINLYVNEKFAKVSEFEDLQTLYPEECSKLIHEVVNKAQGVFLWVYLVVLSLSQGMVDGDSMSALQARLTAIPGDLEAYFRKIIDGIPEQYRPLAASYFSIMTAVGQDEVSALSLSFLEESSSDFVQIHPVKPVALPLIEARKRSMARRLESRCKGLLQVNKLRDRGNFGDQVVDFLHRTVRDFLLSKDIQQILQQYSSGSLHPFLFLCRSVLTQMKMVGPEEPGLSHLATQYFTYAERLESSTGPAYIGLTELFFELAHGLLLKDPREQERYGSVGSILKVAIAYRLVHYSMSKISSSKFDVNKLYCAHPVLDRDHSTERTFLLWECIPPGTIKDPANPEVTVPIGGPPAPELFAALFARGANPNLKKDELTIWEEYLRQANAMLDRHRSVRLSEGSWTRTTRLFIEHGASSSGRDPRYPPQWRERAAAGKKYRFNAAPQDLADAVQHIFEAPAGRELAEALRARSTVTGRLKKFFVS